MSQHLHFWTRQEAVDYLDSCRHSKNYTAENYADRVAAQVAIQYFDNWSPAPLPPPKTADIPLKKRPARRKQRQ